MSAGVVGREMVGMAARGRVREEYRDGLDAAEMTDRTYEARVDGAGEQLMAGGSVVLDASFTRREHRRAAARLARETGAQYACVEVSAAEDAIRERLAGRLERGRDASDARWEIYVQQRRRFQRPSEVSCERLISVDTSKRGAWSVAPILDALRRVSPLSVPR